MVAQVYNFTAPDANPIVPAANWSSVGQVSGKILTNSFRSTTPGFNAILVYANAVTSATIKVKVKFTVVDGSESHGIYIGNLSGNGYLVLTRAPDIRYFKCSGGVLGAQVGSNFNTTILVTDEISAEYNPVNGQCVISKNGIPLTAYTDLTTNTNMRGGVLSRATVAGISQVSVEDFTTPTIPDTRIGESPQGSQLLGFTLAGSTLTGETI
jgi:hypothetical protein